MVGEIILGQLRDLGVQVFDVSGNELTAGNDDPTRKLIRQVLGAVAEFEKSVMVLKLRASPDRKRRATGRCEGRKLRLLRRKAPPMVSFVTPGGSPCLSPLPQGGQGRTTRSRAREPGCHRATSTYAGLEPMLDQHRGTFPQ